MFSCLVFFVSVSSGLCPAFFTLSSSISLFSLIYFWSLAFAMIGLPYVLNNTCYGFLFSVFHVLYDLCSVFSSLERNWLRIKLNVLFVKLGRVRPPVEISIIWTGLAAINTDFIGTYHVGIFICILHQRQNHSACAVWQTGVECMDVCITGMQPIMCQCEQQEFMLH